MPTKLYATPPIPYVTEKPWTNWGGNQACTPAFTVRPKNEQEVLDVVRFAIREGLPVRAVGAGHSFTPIVQTGGVLIDTELLTGVTGTDTTKNRARVLGGTRISDMGAPLWDAGLSLSNQGDIDKQSISGAIATATHGSGINLGSFSSRLRWARIINGHGEVVEVDENDLNTLRAAQVAIGTLGIMTEVELEVSPRYHIKEEITFRRGTRPKPGGTRTSPTTGTTRSSGARPTTRPLCTNCPPRPVNRWSTAPTPRSTSPRTSTRPARSSPPRTVAPTGHTRSTPAGT